MSSEARLRARISKRERGRESEGGQKNGGLLSADGSVPVGADAAGSAHHPHRVRSPHRLLSRRPWSPPVQRRIFLLTPSRFLPKFQFSISFWFSFFLFFLFVIGGLVC